MIPVSFFVARSLWDQRHVLMASARVELSKRYAGTLLGYGWIAIHPLLFLATYVIVFLLIFQVRFAGQTPIGYVIFMFSGLLPFLALMEVATASAVTVRQNIHLLKNVILPVETMPARVVALAFVPHIAGLAMCLGFVAWEGTWTVRMLALPFVVAVAYLFYLGVAMLIAPIGVIVQDLGHAIGLVLNLMMFLSPIAFRRDMVPDIAKVLVDYNPVTYLIEAYRVVLIAGYEVDWSKLAVMLAMSVAIFEIGARVMMRFKASIIDYE